MASHHSLTRETMQFPKLKETHFLEALWWGLDHLATENRKIENRVRDTLQLDPVGDDVLIFSNFGSGPEDTVVLNYFVWYANSVVPFLKLFSKAYSPKENWRTTFPEVLKWRNKVSSHPAYTDPQNDDNIPSQQVSIMMTPDWENDCFVVGRWRIGGNEGFSHRDWGWSLTKTHRELIAFVTRNKK